MIKINTMNYKLLLLCFVILFSCKGISQEETTKKKETFKVTKTKQEWQNQLTPMQYQVLREAATESPFSSPLLTNKKNGIYVCVGCDTPLFKSENKFKSGTGWPSFDREIEGNVSYDVDYKIGYKRTEEHCATCGGHLGHVFEDGPKTTGLRHCINGAALKFVPKK